MCTEEDFDETDYFGGEIEKVFEIVAIQFCALIQRLVIQ